MRRFSSGVRYFSSGLFLSRLSGMVRDFTMAYAFGAHSALAALLIAFRFSSLLRRFFGEGALQAAFIPQFEALRVKDSKASYAFFRNLTTLLILLLLFVTFLIEGVLGFLLSFSSLSSENREIIRLAAYFFPTLLFICLYGLNTAFLQCHRMFFLSNFAPVVCNLSWIIGAFSLRNASPKEAMVPLSRWIILGIILQWAVTLPSVVKQMGGSFRLWWDRKNVSLQREVLQLARAFRLGAMGVGAVQLNSFFDSLFSRFANLSGPVYLWNASRLYQLAFAIFGIATIHTLIPTLSNAIKRREEGEGKAIFIFSFRRLIFIMLPCTAAILTLNFPVIDLLFGWGKFSTGAAKQTARCLSAYAIGLMPASAILLDSAICYAKGNFRLPTLASIGAVIVNVSWNAVLIFVCKLGPFSVALSTSISSWMHFLFLRHILANKGWQIDIKKKDWLHIFGSTLFAASLAKIALLFLSLPLPKGLTFFVPAICFIFGLFVYGRVFRSRDLCDLFRVYFGLRNPYLY